MHQTKESNKRAPGRVVINISVHLVSIYTLTFSNVLLLLALNLIVHKSSYCKCSLAWCQARTILLFTIWTHPLQMREYPLQYASTDKNKKSHYNRFSGFILSNVTSQYNLNSPREMVGPCLITFNFSYLTVVACTSGNLVIQVQHGFSLKKTGWCNIGPKN